jgi:hypothetical protein
VKVNGEPTIPRDVLAGLARDIGALDEELGKALDSAFKDQKFPVPTENVIAVADLWIKHTGLK